MKVLLALCVIGVVVLLQLIDEGETVCCPTHRLNKNRLCDDCRSGTPYCGKGKCNLFGCSCKGGCRRGLCGGHDDDWPTRRRRRSPAAHDVIRQADTDEDGRLSRGEAHAHLAERGIPDPRIRLFLDESDLDRDEFYTAREIDP